MLVFAPLYLALVLTAEPAASLRRFHEIDHDLSLALRAESTAQNLTQRGAAVRQLARLFTELDRDPRLLQSAALQEHRARARGRLVTVQKSLLRDIARAEKKRTPNRATSYSTAQTATMVATADVDQRSLGAELADEVVSAHALIGGPAALFEVAVDGLPGGGAVSDHGEELVDLITRTIFPDQWKVNGGEATIVYYRPLMCLVVTATGTTHGGVQNLIDGLRAAGP